ncbi:MAG: DnaA/Hda family protein, partial [Caldilineaceae bacterium]
MTYRSTLSRSHPSGVIATSEFTTSTEEHSFPCDADDEHERQTDYSAAPYSQYPYENLSKEREAGNSAQPIIADWKQDSATAKHDFDAHAIWQMLLSELSLQMQSATYNTWVRDTWVIAYEDGEFIIGLPNAYARDWLENRLRHKIKRVLSSLIHRSVQIQFRVCPQPVSDSPNAAPVPLYQSSSEFTSNGAALTGSPASRQAHARKPETPAVIARTMALAQSGPETTARSQLNSYYTFESFVVGNHNKLAHAAAEAVAERPGQSFNP